MGPYMFAYFLGSFGQNTVNLFIQGGSINGFFKALKEGPTTGIVNKGIKGSNFNINVMNKV